jgi:biopolymer transport protein ExbD
VSDSARGGFAKTGATGTHDYTHSDFTYVRRKRRGGHSHGAHDESADAGELNVVPYLDILINLIMFLLVAQATLVSLGLIDVTAPSYTPVGAGSDTPPPEAQLRLTIGVAAKGFYIAAKGGVLPGESPETATTEITPDGVALNPPTIPKRADGSYDFPALARKLRAIKTAFPNVEAVYIAADDNVPYEVIVKTLDASREDAQGHLFPSVAFTQIN